MPELIYFSSGSGNTARFVARLDFAAQQVAVRRIPISPAEELPLPSDDYVLMLPTFADGAGRGAVPKQVIRFLNDPARRARIKGVIAGGNRNFGATFALAGKIVAEKCNVPLLYRFELAGTDVDLARVRSGLLLFWGMECSTMA